MSSKTLIPVSLSLTSKDSTKRVLDLDVKAFSVMVMGEKRKEYRDPTRNFQKRLKIGEYKFVIESIWWQCCLDFSWYFYCSWVNACGLVLKAVGLSDD